jgi:hypothetical protein
VQPAASILMNLDRRGGADSARHGFASARNASRNTKSIPFHSDLL